ncbi:MAG: hypothetical protein RML45_10535 [Acetobacteraceae bacterium]|nr:hypothetical protein [Acetobacteraceae bacterium]
MKKKAKCSHRPDDLRNVPKARAEHAEEQSGSGEGDGNEGKPERKQQDRRAGQDAVGDEHNHQHRGGMRRDEQGAEDHPQHMHAVRQPHLPDDRLRRDEGLAALRQPGLQQGPDQEAGGEVRHIARRLDPHQHGIEKPKRRPLPPHARR